VKKLIQTLVAVPISETIGRSFGTNTTLGTGATLLSARVVMRSFRGMLLLGAIAGALNYIQVKKTEAADETLHPIGKTPHAA